jgi:hypothetical protein
VGRFLCVLTSSIDPRDLESHRIQETRKTSQTAADVDGREEAHRAPDFFEKARNNSASRTVQQIIVMLVKDSRRPQ